MKEKTHSMEFDPQSIPWQTVYKLMIGAVVPRPIGWVSTIDSGGKPNLAPFSFFNVASANPAHVLFCPMIRGSDGNVKDTLRNLLEAQEAGRPAEFVVNIVTEALADRMNLTSGEYGPEISEFTIASLITAPSVMVQPPRVAESPVHFECVVSHILKLGEGQGSASVVVGKVVQIHVDERVLLGTDKINLKELQPVGRLAGTAYTRVTDTFELKRPEIR